MSKRIRGNRVDLHDTYRGKDIYIDDDNLFYVQLDGKDYCFDSQQEAEDFIDDIPATKRYQIPSKKKFYYIYVAGTYKNNRAKYLKRNRKTVYCSEAQADVFTEDQMRSILKNSSTYDSYEAK